MRDFVIASEAKQSITQQKERVDCFVATLLAMTAGKKRGIDPYRTTPEVNPALRRGGLISFFR